jgi:uncharacterized protein (TIGR02271 family)
MDTQTVGTRTQTVVGLFDSFSDAQAVVRDLEREGFTRDDISIVANDANGEYTSTTRETHKGDSESPEVRSGDTASGAGKGAVIGGVAGLALGLAALAIPGIGPVVAAGPIATALAGAGVGAAAGGLIGALTHLGVPEEDARYYDEGVRQGGALVMVKASGERASRAAEILESSGAENVDKDAHPTIRASGDRGTSERPNATYQQNEREVKVPVVKEDLAVGKRQVNKGGVRVFSHMSEQPVQENVNLREEHVHVDRRPVDREATEADFQNFKEGTIEVRETAEEPVVSKRKRVVEEVAIGKDVTSRTEQVKDNVRQTEVNVEKLPPNEPARTRAVGSTYDDESSPAYRYGSELANDPRYRGKQWNIIEPEVRRNWDTRGEGAWESAKDSIRRGWEKMTGQR